MKRRSMLAILLAICLMISLIPIGALAEEKDTVQPAAVEEQATADSKEEITEESASGASSETEGEDRDSLAYAVKSADEAGTSVEVELDLKEIAEKYGEEKAKFSFARQSDVKYNETKKPGSYTLKADGEERYILITNAEDTVLWAGIYSGEAGDVPQAILYYEPEESELAKDAVVIDVSAAAKEFDGKITVRAKEGNEYKDVPAEKDGTYKISVAAEKKHVLIVWGDENNVERSIWAGAFAKDDAEAPQVLKFFTYQSGETKAETAGQTEMEGNESGVKPTEEAAVAPTAESTPEPVQPSIDDLQFEIVSVSRSEGIAIRFPADTLKEEIFKDITLKIDFKDEMGQSVVAQDDVTPVVSEDEEDPSKGIYVYNGEIPREAVSVTVMLQYCGNVVGSRQGSIPEIQAPVIAIENDKVLSIGGKATISGTIHMMNGEKDLDDWNIVINGVVCELDTLSLVKEGEYSFGIVDYSIGEDTTKLEIYAEDKKQTEVRSETVVCPVEPAVIQVRISNYEGIYDGEKHAITASAEEEVAFFYMTRRSDDREPMGEWKEGIPEQIDADKYDYFIKAEKEGYKVEYVDADGQPIESEGGYVTATIDIEQKEVTVKVWAEQKGEAVYTGKEQKIPVEYKVSVEEDESGLFKLETITENPKWKEEGTVSAKDAGSHSVVPENGQFDFIEKLDENFKVKVDWQEDSEVVIDPKEIVLESGSKATVYGAQSGALKNDEKVEATPEIEDNDCYSGDLMACGVQKTVGVSRNKIQISGIFGERQSNYKFDLEEGEGVLVMFPQSINEEDESWEKAEARINPKDYADVPADELPGFYLDMRVELPKNEGKYDGTAQDIAIRFRKKGDIVQLEEESDYTVEYYRDGVKTEDITNAGTVTVKVTGCGNYRGVVELTYEIKPNQVVDTGVKIDGWIYDGQSADSPAHPVTAVAPSKYTYRDAAGNEIDPPVDAGSYTVQAIWDATGNSSAAQSELYAFEIRPVDVTVTIENGKVTEIDDASGLFDESMIERSGENYECTSGNFNVEFNVIEAEPEVDKTVEPSVSMDSWYYDGTAANDTHKAVLTGIDATKVTYRYYNAVTGEKIEAPVDVGVYTLVAAWSESEGAPEQTVETSFAITSRPVTVQADDAEKVYGEADPELKASVHGVLGEDPISCEISRADGEEAGSYEIILHCEERQGNYSVKCVNGTLTIRPKSVAGISVELLDDEAVVRDDDGTRLTEGTDYTISIADSASEPGKKEVRVQGIGNYMDEFSTVCAVTAVEAKLTLTDAEGQEIPQDGLSVDGEGMVSFAGTVEFNVPVEQDWLKVLVGGQNVNAAVEAQSDTAYRFSVTQYAVSGEKPENIAVQIAVNGKDKAVQTVGLNHSAGKTIWLLCAIAMAIGAAICCVICMNLTKQLKKEKMKLLDAVSRQSNRTIRHSQD